MAITFSSLFPDTAGFLFNGNTSITTAPSGSISFNVAGVSNVAVFSATTGTIQGNISANYFVGNGSQLTSVVDSTAQLYALLAL